MRGLTATKRGVIALVGTVLLLAGVLLFEPHAALFGQGVQTRPKEPAAQNLGFSGGLAISPDGKTVAAGQGSNVCIWDVKSGKLLSTLTGHTKAVTAVVYASDARTLYSGGLDGSVVAWNISAGGTPQELKLQSAIVGLAISTDGQSLFVRTDGQSLQSFDLSSGMLKNEIRLGSSAQ